MLYVVMGLGLEDCHCRCHGPQRTVWVGWISDNVGHEEAAMPVSWAGDSRRCLLNESTWMKAALGQFVACTRSRRPCGEISRKKVGVQQCAACGQLAATQTTCNTASSRTTICTLYPRNLLQHAHCALPRRTRLLTLSRAAVADFEQAVDKVQSGNKSPKLSRFRKYDSLPDEE